MPAQISRVASSLPASERFFLCLAVVRTPSPLLTGFCTSIHKLPAICTAYPQCSLRFLFRTAAACCTLSLTQRCIRRCVVLPGSNSGERHCTIQQVCGFRLCGDAKFCYGTARAIAADGGGESTLPQGYASPPWQQGRRLRDGRGAERKPPATESTYQAPVVGVIRLQRVVRAPRFPQWRRERVTTRSAVHCCRPGEAAGFSGPDFHQPFFFCLYLEALTSVSAAFSAPSTVSTLRSPSVSNTIQTVLRKFGC